MILAAVVREREHGNVFRESAEDPSCVDLGELPGISNEYHLGLAFSGVGDESTELRVPTIPASSITCTSPRLSALPSSSWPMSLVMVCEAMPSRRAVLPPRGRQGSHRLLGDPSLSGDTEDVALACSGRGDEHGHTPSPPSTRWRATADCSSLIVGRASMAAAIEEAEATETKLPRPSPQRR